MDQVRGVEDEPVYTKIYFDYVKHLNTLATGSIIVEVSFFEKIFPHPHWKLLAALSLAFFTVSVISALLLYSSTVTAAGRSLVTRKDDRAGRILLRLILFGFLVGITSLAVFGMRNLLAL
jgi:hypothetical protein